MSNFIESDTVMPIKTKSVMIDEYIEDQKKQKMIDDDDDVFPSSCLPEDLILENILTRVSAKDLARFTSVSKSWYNSILNDTQFALSHFARHRNRRNLSFNLLNVSRDDDKEDKDGVFRNYFFNLQKDNSNRHDSDCFYNFELLSGTDSVGGSVEVVGNCNGLACVECSSEPNFVKMCVLSTFRKEALTLTHITPQIAGVHSIYLCHGFGFDSSTQEYKIVVIYTTETADFKQGFICMVVTLGDTVWRKIVISLSEISPPLGRSSFPNPMSITLSDDFWDYNRSATICGGDLFWRIEIRSPDDSYDYDNYTHEIEMLLSFDVHNEKIQFIRLPNKCNSLITAMNGEENRCLEFRHHLLEFKGYPCVARTEKISVKERLGTDDYQWDDNEGYGDNGGSTGAGTDDDQWDDNEGYGNNGGSTGAGTESPTAGKGMFDEGYGNNGSNTGVGTESSNEPRFVCYQFKVQLYILTDKVNQMWIEDETFDVRVRLMEDSVSGSLLQDPHSIRTRIRRTRMFSFSDQVMLYWFNGRCLIFYNLGQKHHNVINGTHSCNKQIHDIFEAKITGLRPYLYAEPECCPSIDYQLHKQVENIISLKTFIPKRGEVGEFDCYEEFQQFVTDKQPTGWLYMGRKSPKWYAFF